MVDTTHVRRIRNKAGWRFYVGHEKVQPELNILYLVDFYGYLGILGAGPRRMDGWM